MKKMLFVITLIIAIGCNNKEETNDFTKIVKDEIYATITDSIKKFPKEDTLYLGRALLLTKNKQYEAALIDFTEAWELKENEDNGIFLGVGYINLSRYKDAIAHFVQLTQKFPDNLMIRERLAFCFEQSNLPNEAINQYDYILKKDPEDYVTMATKAYALQQMNNDAEAIKWFEKSYNGIPNLTIGNELALMYAESKNPKTIALCDVLIKEDSSENKNVQPIYAKGLYYKNIGNYGAAMPLLDDCIKLDYTFPYAYLDKSVILYDQKKYDEAIKILEIAKQNDNKNSEVYYRMGKCLEAKGNKEGAKLEYERALALEPDYEVAKEALGKL
jgi:tetratricopeptide (TPR) repeat protein